MAGLRDLDDGHAGVDGRVAADALVGLGLGDVGVGDLDVVEAGVFEDEVLDDDGGVGALVDDGEGALELEGLDGDVLAVEDEDRTDESVEGAIRTVNRLLRIEVEILRDINLDAVRNWSEGNRSGIWAKFCMDFASGYDQTVAIHAVYIIHTLWWRLNEADEDADDMLREVSQRWNTAASTEALQRSEASLLLCAGALELATALYHKTLDTNFHNIFRSSGQLRVADVGDYIQSRIGWRVLLTTPDNMLAQHYEIPALYGGMMYWQRDLFRERCNAVARVAACVELLYPWPPAILAAAIILHVRQTMGIDPAWTPALDRATGCFSEAQLEPTRRDLVRWVPDPANTRWPWVPVGGDDSSDDADY